MQRILTFAWITFITAMVAHSAETPPASADEAGALRVMSFNIRYSGARDGENSWPKRKESVIATIRAFNPDLLGLQEVLADQFDTLREMLPDYTAVGVARDDGERQGEFSAIFFRSARFSPSDSGTFWLSMEPEKVGSTSWDAACVRICTWAKLRNRQSGFEFLHANTHFDHRSELARVESAKLLRDRLPQMAQGKPVILTGDFNAIEDHEAYKILVNAEVPEARRFFDAYRLVHPERSREEATFNGFKKTIVGSRIDWILHTRHFKPLAAEIVRTATPEVPFVSDHYPVTAVLKMEAIPPEAPAP